MCVCVCVCVSPPTLAFLYALRKGHVRTQHLYSSATQGKPSPDTDADVLRVFNLQNCRNTFLRYWKNTFLLFKLPNLWYFVKAAWAKTPAQLYFFFHPPPPHLPNFKTLGNEKQDENPGRLVPESVFLSLAYIIPVGFPVAQVKSPPANAGEVSSVPGSGRLPGEGNGNYSILARKILWKEEPGRLWTMGLQGVGHELVTNTFHFILS